MSDTTSGAISITYGTHTIPDVLALPRQSIAALAQSGLTHKLGNEVASAVTAWIKRQIRDAAGDPKLEVSTDQVKAWRAANEAAVATQSATEQAAAFAEILSGETTARSGGPKGPKLSEMELEVRSIATDEVAVKLIEFKILETNKAGEYLVVATGKKPTSKDKLVTQADGEECSLQRLAERRLAVPSNRERIERLAAKRIADRKAALARIATTTDNAKLAN